MDSCLCASLTWWCPSLAFPLMLTTWAEGEIAARYWWAIFKYTPPCMDVVQLPPIYCCYMKQFHHRVQECPLSRQQTRLRIFYTWSNLDETSIVDEILYIAVKTAFPQLYLILSDKTVIHSNIQNFTISFIFKLYFSMNYHICTKYVCLLWICIVSGFQVIKLSFSEQDVWIYLFLCQ